MRSQGISPLNLSPDYIKIEDKAPEPKILDIKKRTSWKTRDKALIDYSRKTGKDNQYFRNIRDRTPIVYSFIRFHGKGDLGKGYLYYKEYWDKVRAFNKMESKNEN